MQAQHDLTLMCWLAGAGQADSQKENGAPHVASKAHNKQQQRQRESPTEPDTAAVGLGGSAGGGGMAKKYGLRYIWGQLTGWHKQTVYDPTASLSAERRGTISLPDLESCSAGAKSRYSAKVSEGGGRWGLSANAYAICVLALGQAYIVAWGLRGTSEQCWLDLRKNGCRRPITIQMAWLMPGAWDTMPW